MLTRCFPTSCLPRASCFCNLILISHQCWEPFSFCYLHSAWAPLPSPLEFSVCTFSLGFSPPSLSVPHFLSPSFLSFPVSTCCESDTVIIYFFLDFYCFGLCLVICEIVSLIPSFRRQRQALLILELCKFKASMVYILNCGPPRTV